MTDGKISTEIYLSGNTRRWHTHKRLQQTVAEHCWGTAMLILMEHPNPSLNLVKAALMHDLHETEFGDIPPQTKEFVAGLKQAEREHQRAFFKRMKINYPELTEEEQWWLDYADKTEALLFLCTTDIQDYHTEIMKRILANRIDALTHRGVVL